MRIAVARLGEVTCKRARNLPRVEALAGTEVVTLAPNVPGPVAAARLRDLGAHVTKIEAPSGDLLSRAAPRWYAALHENVTIETLDLKSAAGREALEERLRGADVLLTSSRISALDRLSLGWEKLHARQPTLVHVAIVGYPPPDDERPGHDLNYVGQLGLVDPPALPLTLVADLAGAERAVSATLGLLLNRERGRGAARELVSLRDAATVFGEPLAHGMTVPGGSLGGGTGIYHLYAASDGWVAVGALEPHFAARLGSLLKVPDGRAAALASVFAERSVSEWETWAGEHDLPISAVKSRS
jgi:crotonobetainyl-CoA:carnitine CoA-transferase CaiB-like acyl-CoA transferase